MDRHSICRALGNIDRVKLLRCLERPKTVTELLDHCELGQSALSQHLRILRDAKLVTTIKEGKFVRYGVANKQVQTITKLLLEITT